MPAAKIVAAQVTNTFDALCLAVRTHQATPKIVDVWIDKVTTRQQFLLMGHALRLRNAYLIKTAYNLNPGYWRRHGIDALGCIVFRRSTKICTECKKFTEYCRSANSNT